MIYLIIYFNGGKTENELIMKAQSTINVKEKNMIRSKTTKIQKLLKNVKINYLNIFKKLQLTTGNNYLCKNRRK